MQKRTEKLSDIPEQIDFFEKLPEYDNSLFVHKKMKTNEENSKTALLAVKELFENQTDWSFDALHDAAMGLVEKLGVKNGQLLYPLRVALSGKAFTPGGGIELAEILGRDESLKRIDIAINKL